MKTLLLMGAAMLLATQAHAGGKTIMNAFGKSTDLTIVSSHGVDTANAEIKVRNASKKSGVLKANCDNGDFQYWKSEYRFLGAKDKDDVGAKYKVLDPSTNVILDGSAASTYPDTIAVFHALCPSKAPAPYFYQ